jgi:flagellar hook-basal body complex protein FliE
MINVSRFQPPLPNIEMQTAHPQHVAISNTGVLAQGMEVGRLDKPVSFETAMLRALDGVSQDHNKVGAMVEKAITDPGSVDIHDVTIAQAKASMSLNITRTVLSRLVQGWRDIVNTR